jgi:thiosulfate/3-mercaptopyruvate sulfurtransferase
LPDAHALAQTFSRLGTRAVCRWWYDQGNGIFASRLWWMLRWLGHDAAAVLDGGSRNGSPRAGDGWRRAAQAREFSGAPRSAMAVSVDEVASHIGTPEWRLVDARAPERYRGETEPIDNTPGHIPGATNHFYQWNLDEEGLFLTPEQLRARLQKSLGDQRPDEIVCYCGSGVTACHTLLALEHAGMKGAKL